MAKAVYKYFYDCGRMGDLEGLFVADSADVERALAGEAPWASDCLGKHSEIQLQMGGDRLKLITDNPEFVALFEKFELSTGINPIERFLENE